MISVLAGWTFVHFLGGTSTCSTSFQSGFHSMSRWPLTCATARRPGCKREFGPGYGARLGPDAGHSYVATANKIRVTANRSYFKYPIVYKTRSCESTNAWRVHVMRRPQKPHSQLQSELNVLLDELPLHDAPDDVKQVWFRCVLLSFASLAELTCSHCFLNREFDW